MIVLNVMLTVWCLAAVFWAVLWGHLGWKTAEKTGVDPGKAAALAWLVGPFALPVIRRWRKSQVAGVAIAERVIHGTNSAVGMLGRAAQRFR